MKMFRTFFAPPGIYIYMYIYIRYKTFNIKSTYNIRTILQNHNIGYVNINTKHRQRQIKSNINNKRPPLCSQKGQCFQVHLNNATETFKLSKMLCYLIDGRPSPRNTR